MVLLEIFITVAAIGLGALALIGWVLRPVFRWVVRQCRIETQQEQKVAEVRRQLDEQEKAARNAAQAEVEQLMTDSETLHTPAEWPEQQQENRR
jgi:hypothetical protein